MKRSSLRTALVLGAALRVSTGHAQAPEVRVEQTDCPSDLGAAVESALGVELSMATPEARAALADGTLRCALVCDAGGATVAIVRGDDRLEQRIEGDGPGLARRLAIVLAELLDASSAPVPEPEEPEPEGPEPERAALDPGLHADAPSEPLRARLRLAGGAWLGGEPLSALGGLELGVELAPTQNVAIVIGVAGTLGAIDVAAGRLDVRLVSAAASLRLGGELDALWLGGGPAIRGGVVLWSGTPVDPTRAVGRDTTGGWLGLGAVGAAFVRAGDTPLRVGLEAEGGGIAFHSEALVLGARGARIGAGWIELRLAVDLTLD